MKKKGLKYHKKTAKITEAEGEVLHLLLDEFLTIKQIAQQRQCSIQAVYKIRRNLIKKGLFGTGLKKVEKVESTNGLNMIRLHAQEFNIKVLWQGAKYQKLMKRSNLLFLDSNTIRLYKNSIEIYSGNSFLGKDVGEADRKSVEYWTRFFMRLEHELGITFVKDRSRNIKEVNHHYARGDSEICDNAIENKQQVRVFAIEDGKLAFITDDSFGFREDETLHPITGKPDREAIDKQVNDWRLNNPPTNSQLAQHIKGIANNQEAFAKDMVYYGKQIQSHIKAVQDLGKGVRKFTSAVSNLAKENKELKKKLEDMKQKKLSDFRKI